MVVDEFVYVGCLSRPLNNRKHYTKIGRYMYVWIWIANIFAKFRNTTKAKIFQNVLWGLLFWNTLYVNDIGNCVPNSPSELYADDTNIFIYGETVESLTEDAVKYITRLSNW